MYPKCHNSAISIMRICKFDTLPSPTCQLNFKYHIEFGPPPTGRFVFLLLQTWMHWWCYGGSVTRCGPAYSTGKTQHRSHIQTHLGLMFKPIFYSYEACKLIGLPFLWNLLFFDFHRRNLHSGSLHSKLKTKEFRCTVTLTYLQIVNLSILNKNTIATLWFWLHYPTFFIFF